MLAGEKSTMADTTPRLIGGTDANTLRYAPLSWMGMAAFFVAMLFAVLLFTMGGLAYIDGRTLLSPILIVLPVLGLILTFIARQSINNAEGAVTGKIFVSIAWWVCLVGGLCYGAYWLAVDWSVRTTAERQMTEWLTKYITADPSNPNDPSIKEAFLKTLPPANAEGEFARNPALFNAQFALPLQGLRNNNLLLMAHRNPGQVTIQATGLRTWNQVDDETTAETMGLFKCPEGEFPIALPVKSKVNNKKREWQVELPRTLIPEEKSFRPIGNRTKYGWLILNADLFATRRAEEFLETLTGYANKQPLERPGMQYAPPPALGQSVARRTMVDTASADLFSARVALSTLGRLQAMGGLGVFFGDPSLPSPDFIGRADGKPLSEQDRQTLTEFWLKPVRNRLSPAGQINPVMPIRNNFIEITDKELVVKVPIEAAPVAQPFVSRPKSFTVAWIVLVCDDPEVMAELNAARQAGGPLTVTPPEGNRRNFPYRVRRIESDLIPIDPPMDPTAGQPPQGMGG
jgi:hypothetical protein